MSTLHMNRLNRQYINRLKIKGAEWLKKNIELEEKLNQSTNDASFELYIQAMKKALGEIQEQEEINA
jgi:hypothetical protein